MSLAKKISLLFGAAVLLTIAATLTFPWQQMAALQEQTLLLEAKRAAGAAYQALELDDPDWAAAQAGLRELWPTMSQRLDLITTPPRVVRIGEVGPGFQADAVARLTEYPEQKYYWRIQGDGLLFRVAMAVRSPTTASLPDRLNGIIDVSLPIEEDMGVWNWVITVLAGASGAMLAILAFYLATQRLVLTPVRSLRRVAEKVTSGDIDVRASIQSRDEFEQLAEALNDMLTHLKAAQEEQHKINRSLDIKLGELAETNVALYEATKVKSEFLANVTHELRTPLVSIIGFAELLNDMAELDEPDKIRLKRYARNILTSGRSLLDLINDLLDLAKIESGRIELHISDFSIDELCRDLIDFVGPLADKRNQKLALTVAEDLPAIHSDAGRIKQILYNLLSNAIKFSPTGGAISVVVEPAGEGRVRMNVRDSGPGIAPENLDKIFEQFQQLDASTTREHAGSGLGLAITRELCHALQGTIEVQSEVGEGAAFIVILPVHVESGAARPPVRLS